MNEIDETNHKVTAKQILLILIGLFMLNVLLRGFYLRYDFVNGDEGVRALTAVRMLEGARLYSEVVTDKPPGATFFYAAVFGIFGRSMKAVHIAASVWNFATAAVLFLFALRYYGRRTALLAALFFVYFSTNYFTQDMMAANTELLMALPYTASFYFFIGAQRRKVNSPRAPLLAAGLFTGLAVLFKQVGLLNLVFFAMYELLSLIGQRKSSSKSLVSSIGKATVRLSTVCLGLAVVLALFVSWLVAIDSLGDFWQNAVLLNMFYIDSEPAKLWGRFLFTRGLGYIFFNATIWWLAIWALARSLAKTIRKNLESCDSHVRLDLAIGGWGAVTLVGVLMGSRFFGHYFIPLLPALSLLAARGLKALAEWSRLSRNATRFKMAVAVLFVLFAIGLVRSHSRTAVLAYETLTGSRTRSSASWGMTKRQEEAAAIASYVTDRISPGEPLYIWGYAHDVYWQTGCRPASRYLTPYYIDGRFPDSEAVVSESGLEFRRQAAANLIEDLRKTKPRLILDVYSTLNSLPHKDLVSFVKSSYRDAGTIGPDANRPFRVLELRHAKENELSARRNARFDPIVYQRKRISREDVADREASEFD